MKIRWIILFLLFASFQIFAQEILIYPELTDNEKSKDVVFSPDGNYFYTTSKGDSLETWNILNASKESDYIYTLPDDFMRLGNQDHFSNSKMIRITPNGKRLISVYADSYDNSNVLAIYDKDSYSLLYSSERDLFGMPMGQCINDVAISYDNQLFASIGYSNEVIELDDEDSWFSKKKVSNEKVGEWFLRINQFNKNSISAICYYQFSFDINNVSTEIGTCIDFNPADRKIVAVGTTRGAFIFNITESQWKKKESGWGYANDFIVKELKCGNVSDIQYSDNKKWLVLSDESNINLYDSKSYRLIKKLKGRDSKILTFKINSLNTFILVSYEDGSIIKWDIETGEKLFELEPSSSKITSIDINKKDQLLIGTSDGKVILLDSLTGRELISFMSFNNDEWISITPDGYYQSSINGDYYINVRNGMNVYPISQFCKSYNHPEVLIARINGVTDPAIVQYYGDIRLAAAPPIVSSELICNELSDTGLLKVMVLDPAMKSKLEKLRVYRNGSLVNVSQARTDLRNIHIEKNYIENTDKTVFSFDIEIPIKLDSGNNYIEVLVDNEFCYGVDTIEYEIKYEIETMPTNLYILSIGIDDYSGVNKSLNLQDLSTAVFDSERITNLFINQEGRRYKTVKVMNISDKQKIKPSYDEIIKSFSVFNSASEDDVCILYIASHGIYQNQKFQIVTRDSKYIDMETILNNFDVLGKKIIILDTCQSGGVQNNIVVKTLKDKSCSIFYAASENELAQEDKIQGGLFTNSITNCFQENENVTLKKLAQYVYENVTENSRVNTRGRIRQHPDCVVSKYSEDFIIAY